MAVARKRPGSYMRVRIAFDQRYNCAMCAQLLEPPWHIDHITPLCSGGSNDRSNLQALCAPCHTGKSAAETTARPRRARKLTALQRLRRMLRRLVCRRGC
jgi:5-methylcytosine-specific restriction endonuclease McrA